MNDIAARPSTTRSTTTTRVTSRTPAPATSPVAADHAAATTTAAASDRRPTVRPLRLNPDLETTVARSGNGSDSTPTSSGSTAWNHAIQTYSSTSSASDSDAASDDPVVAYAVAPESEAPAADAPAETEAPAEPQAGEEEHEVLDANDPDNPYQGEHNATTVDVVAWDPNDDNPNDHLEGILLEQGYSLEEIYGRGEDGQNLLDKVANANDLDSNYTIHPDQTLVVPTTREANNITQDGTADPDNISLDGNDNDNQLDSVAGAGNDVVTADGGAGNDQIHVNGGSGNDNLTVSGGQGADEIEVRGGTGNDNITLDVEGDGAGNVSVVGGTGNDTATINGNGNGTVSYDEETGHNTVTFEDGTTVDVQGVEQVTIGDTTYVADEDGRLVEPGSEPVAEETPATEEPPAGEEPPATEETPGTQDPPAEEPAQPADMTADEALSVLEDDFNWVSDPDNGDGGHTADVDSDLRRFDTNGDWNRDGYVDNLTDSVNPETGEFYTSEEANARADRLEQAAQTVLADEDLLTLVDGADDSGHGDTVDGKFTVDDINRAQTLLDENTQAAFGTLSQYGEAFAYADPGNPGDANRVYKRDVERVADLADNDDFMAHLAGEIDYEEFASRDEDAAGLVGRIYDHLPEGTDRLDAITEMVGAANTVLADGHFDAANRTDGNAGHERNGGDYITLDGDVAGVVDLA